MNNESRLLKQLLITSLFYFTTSLVATADQNDLMDLSVEDLLNIEVTSVAKKAQSLNDSPAAIFVITQDDIRRIGARSIPEALRLAPGLDVAQIDANKWAVTARGFNGRFANKLLVMIDGRNTYTRAFSGVYWENQDVMLDDIERIEVIRGPGASLWGANAVNGVINIITKHSAKTQGGLLVAGAGTQEQGFGAFRYGGELNASTTARAYVKGFKRDENSNESGAGAGDDWGKVQTGFRMDSQASVQDTVTFQGDAYYSDINQYTTFPQLTPPYANSFKENIKSFGGNLLVRHQHTFSSTSDYSLQVFYDFYQRDEVFAKESRHVLDIDFQHRFAMLESNDVVWGLGYRYNHDDFDPSSVAEFVPSSRNDQLFSAFVQDEITLLDNILWLTLGTKIEHNDYSGFEIQPTARLMWVPHHHHRLWGAVSRAVRTPSRLEHDLNILASVTPNDTSVIAVEIESNRQFDSEQVLSYEVGYRTTLINNLSIDFTAFYNDYRHLRTIQLSTPYINETTGVIEVPGIFANHLKAQTYGFEIASVWQMLDWWRWDANYSLLKTDFDGEGVEGDSGRPRSPQQRVSLRSAMSPWQNIDLDIYFRYVDENKVIGLFGTSVIDGYVSMDIRLAWRPVDNLELSLVGQNLLAKQHLEYQQEILTTPTQVNRGMYGKLAWQF